MRGRWHQQPDLDVDGDGDAAATNGPVQTLTSTSTTDQPAFTPVTTLNWRRVPLLVEVAHGAARRLPRARRSAPRLGL